MYRVEMYFGLSCPLPSRTVDIGDRGFSKFVENWITPRFSKGITITDGIGQWRLKGGKVSQEKCKIITAVVPEWDMATQSNCFDIRNQYCELYNQESVLIAVSGLCDVSY